jgi:catechol 2,3-dioxygenase-like lactoylglutathione lyase family enzyme
VYLSSFYITQEEDYVSMASSEKHLSFRDPAVNFFARDVVKEVHFYTDLLGFTETFRTPKDGVPVHVEMRLGQFLLAVTSIDAALADHGLVLNPGPQSAELIVWTDDTDKAYRALVEKGAVSLSAPHDFRETHRVAWVADPEGNPIHIAGPLHRKE